MSDRSSNQPDDLTSDARSSIGDRRSAPDSTNPSTVDNVVKSTDDYTPSLIGSRAYVDIESDVVRTLPETRSIHHGELQAPVSAPTTAIIKNPPLSRTAIERATFRLTDLPTLFVAEVKTLCSLDENVQKTAELWVGVGKNKLRREATTEFLSQPSIRTFAANNAVREGASKTCDHLVAVFDINKTLLKQELRAARYITLTKTKKIHQGTQNLGR